MFNKRISIFTGHFGSGKTEVAVNCAIKLADSGYRTAIVDFDIVNPFFRTKDASDTLTKKGIKVLAPLYANTNVDVPSLPPEINSLFEKKEYRAVFDVGGDDIGARVLSRYREDIIQDDYEMFFVINTRRPMTDRYEKILDMIWSIEESSRIKVTALVNNTNLLGQTSGSDVEDGHRLIKAVSEKLEIPIAFTSAFGNIADLLEQQGHDSVFRLSKHIKLPWD